MTQESYRDLVARGIQEGDVRYIDFPIVLLNEQERKIQKYIFDFVKQNGVMPTKATFINNVERMNGTFFDDINTRYDLITLKNVVASQSVESMRVLYASQYFEEGIITYDEFRDNLNKLDKILSVQQKAFVTAEEMELDLSFLTKGFIKTPIRALNKNLSGGMGYGDMTVFGGGTGVGKSYLITFFIIHALTEGKRVVVNPSEMGKNGYWTRFVAWASGISWDEWLNNFRSDDTSVRERAAQSYSKIYKTLQNEFGNRLIFTSNNYGSPKYFEQVVKGIYDEYNSLDLFVTDTIQDVETNTRGSSKNTVNDNAARTSQDIRNFVTECNDPKVGLYFHYSTTAQFTKSQQNPDKPDKSSLGGSIRNSQDSDYVFGIVTEGANKRVGHPIKTRNNSGGEWEYSVAWDEMKFADMSGGMMQQVYDMKDYFNISFKPLLHQHDN